MVELLATVFTRAALNRVRGGVSVLVGTYLVRLKVCPKMWRRGDAIDAREKFQNAVLGGGQQRGRSEVQSRRC